MLLMFAKDSLDATGQRMWTASTSDLLFLLSPFFLLIELRVLIALKAAMHARDPQALDSPASADQRRASWRTMGWGLLVAVPAILFAGWGMRHLRDWLFTAHGVEIPSYAAALLALAAMWVIVHYTSLRMTEAGPRKPSGSDPN